jgi:hypothetical protein
MAIKRRASFDPKAFLAKVGEGRSIGKYRKEQIVFSQGHPADAVFYLQNGKVKITVVSEQGKEAVVAILETSDFFGEGCLAGQARRIATVATLTDSVIVRLEKSGDCPGDPSGASILRDVHRPSCGPDHPRRSRPRRSAVQFERETSCPAAPAAGEFWQGRKTGADDRENQPGDAGGDDRHDPVPREFLHEQISIGLHSLQRRHRSPQFIAESRSARGAAHRDLDVFILLMQRNSRSV